MMNIVDGLSMRAIARRAGVHASTVMRQIRRVEDARDDPEIDAFLTRAETCPRHRQDGLPDNLAS